MSSLLFDHCSKALLKTKPAWGRFNPRINSKNISERIAAVLEYRSEVRRMVPNSDFLDFDYRRDGWATLA
eukprot:CAMPEP_0168495394 /NCGR_PEP_ID=MMETSP0228-20121227/71716_1 /TAXON_ID=133427 /ORGANISM="Protoceratium reticulatum, Strain CCCM 535 (=CCMP 1889)" /LENGTH=69 /DNA_ID=CAMNT_0008512215 /DNA_START=40 /DNA_END=246 /DNA_ORIENTATION=+